MKKLLSSYPKEGTKDILDCARIAGLEITIEQYADRADNRQPIKGYWTAYYEDDGSKDVIAAVERFSTAWELWAI